MASPVAYEWFLRDGFAALLSSVAAMSLLRLWDELARRRIFEQAGDLLTFMGGIAMALTGFIASVGFGYIQESWQLDLGFLLVSIVAAIVESLPVSTKLDDNLTVTLASVLAGSLIL